MPNSSSDDQPTPTPKSLFTPLPEDQAQAIKTALSSPILGWDETGYGELNRVYCQGERGPWNALRNGEHIEGYPSTCTARNFFGKIDGKESLLTQITMVLGDEGILQYPNRDREQERLVPEAEYPRNCDFTSLCMTVKGTASPIDITEKIRIRQLPNEIKIENALKFKDPGRPIRELANELQKPATPIKKLTHRFGR